jgi:hypothetical protein
MAKALLWALPGVALYMVLMGIASNRLCPERFEKAQKTAGIFALLVWWIPDVFFGSHGALAASTIFMAIGFPAAAVYVVALLIQEMRDTSSLKADRRE